MVFTRYEGQELMMLDDRRISHTHTHTVGDRSFQIKGAEKENKG